MQMLLIQKVQLWKTQVQRNWKIKQVEVSLQGGIKVINEGIRRTGQKMMNDKKHVWMQMWINSVSYELTQDSEGSILFCHNSPSSSFLISLREFFKIFYLFIFRERGREGEREGEKHQCVVASHAPPTGDTAHNPGMCSDWESNQ